MSTRLEFIEFSSQSKLDLCGEVIEKFTAWNTQWKRAVVERYWPDSK